MGGGGIPDGSVVRGLYSILADHPSSERTGLVHARTTPLKGDELGVTAFRRPGTAWRPYRRRPRREDRRTRSQTRRAAPDAGPVLRGVPVGCEESRVGRPRPAPVYSRGIEVVHLGVRGGAKSVREDDDGPERVAAMAAGGELRGGVGTTRRRIRPRIDRASEAAHDSARETEGVARACPGGPRRLRG